MEINKRQLDTEDIGELESITSGIASENIGLALKLVSKSLYSNPIGSFIREIASNGVDANVDLKVDNPVKINIFREEEDYYITFKDEGTGMSKETMEHLYMKWFSSDKRTTNEKIGGWGLGSKSPLAYQDSFEITTIYNGVQYDYLYIDEEPISKLYPISQNPTNEHSGTTVKVAINKDDLWKVHKECVKQLCYFDNVYVKNEIYYYDNEFKIYESNHFKLRNKDQPFGNDMHICLGQVAYPINWNTLNMSPIKVPVAIKFNVGELEVTLSREEINYTEETKKTLIDKIELVKEYLMELYTKQLEIDDLFKYLNIIRERYKPKLTIGDMSIAIDIENFKVSPKFEPLDLSIKRGDLYNLFGFYTVNKVYNGNVTNGDIHDILDNKNSSFLCKERMNTYDTLYLSENSTISYVIRRNKLNKYMVYKLANILKLNKSNSYPSNLKLKEGASKKIYSLIKYIDKYLDYNLAIYDGIATDEWIENYKQEQKELYEERKKSITTYNIYNNRNTIPLSELYDNFKFSFYISKKAPKQDIINYWSLYQSLPSYFRNKVNFLIINPTTISKLKSKGKFTPIENIFKVKNLKSHFRRIKISYIYETQIDEKSILFQYSEKYEKLYREIRRKHCLKINYNYYEVPSEQYNYPQDFRCNIYEVFKDKIDNAGLNKGYTTLYLEHRIPELIAFLKKMDIFYYILQPYNNAEKIEMPFNYIVSLVYKFKILNLKPKYYKQLN